MNSEKIGEGLFAALQENIQLFESVSEELRFQTKTTLQSQLSKLDLVSREEFDATRASLDRALSRIEELEKQLVSQK